MKNFNIWAGLSLGCMSLWYHIAGFVAGLLIDTNNIVPFTLHMGADDTEVTLSEEDIKYFFLGLVWVNFTMFIMQLMVSVFTYIGRAKSAKDGTSE